MLKKQSVASVKHDGNENVLKTYKTLFATQQSNSITAQINKSRSLVNRTGKKL